MPTIHRDVFFEHDADPETRFNSLSELRLRALRDVTYRVGDGAQAGMLIAVPIAGEGVSCSLTCRGVLIADFMAAQTRNNQLLMSLLGPKQHREKGRVVSCYARNLDIHPLPHPFVLEHAPSPSDEHHHIIRSLVEVPLQVRSGFRYPEPALGPLELWVHCGFRFVAGCDADADFSNIEDDDCLIRGAVAFFADTCRRCSDFVEACQLFELCRGHDVLTRLSSHHRECLADVLQAVIASDIEDQAEEAIKEHLEALLTRFETYG